MFSTPLRMAVLDAAAEDDTVMMVRARSEGILFTGDKYENNHFFMSRFNEEGMTNYFVEFFDTLRTKETMMPGIIRWRAELSRL